jgi:hypothetical protein
VAWANAQLHFALSFSGKKSRPESFHLFALGFAGTGGIPVGAGLSRLLFSFAGSRPTPVTCFAEACFNFRFCESKFEGRRPLGLRRLSRFTGLGGTSARASLDRDCTARRHKRKFGLSSVRRRFRRQAEVNERRLRQGKGAPCSWRRLLGGAARPETKNELHAQKTTSLFGPSSVKLVSRRELTQVTGS